MRTRQPSIVAAQVMKKKGDAQQQVLMTAAEAKQRLNDALAQKVLFFFVELMAVDTLWLCQAIAIENDPFNYSGFSH